MKRGKADGLGTIYGPSGELLLRSESERFFGRRVLHVTVGASRGLLGPKGGETFRALVYLTNLRVVAIGTVRDDEIERHVPSPVLAGDSSKGEGPARDYLELPRREVVKFSRGKKAAVLSVKTEAGTGEVLLHPASVATRLLTPLRTA